MVMHSYIFKSDTENVSTTILICTGRKGQMTKECSQNTNVIGWCSLAKVQ